MGRLSSSNISRSSSSEFEEKDEFDPVKQASGNALIQPLMLQPIHAALEKSASVEAKIVAAQTTLPTVAKAEKSYRQQYIHEQKKIVERSAQRVRQIGDRLAAIKRTAPVGAPAAQQHNFVNQIDSVVPVFQRDIAVAEIQTEAAAERSEFYASTVDRFLQRLPLNKHAGRIKKHRVEIDNGLTEITERVTHIKATLDEAEKYLAQIEQQDAPVINERRNTNELRKQAELVLLDAERLSKTAASRQKFNNASSVFDSAKPRHIEAQKDARLMALAVDHAKQIGMNAEKMLAAVREKSVPYLPDKIEALPHFRVDTINPSRFDVEQLLEQKNAALSEFDLVLTVYEAQSAEVNRQAPERRPLRRFDAPRQQMKIEADRQRRHAALLCFEQSKDALTDVGARLRHYRDAVANDQGQHPANTRSWQAINAQKWKCNLPAWRREIQTHASSATAESALVRLYDGDLPKRTSIREEMNGALESIEQMRSVIDGGAPGAIGLLDQSRDTIAEIHQLIAQSKDNYFREALLTIVQDLENQLHGTKLSSTEYQRRMGKLQKAAGSVIAKVVWFERPRIGIELGELRRDADSVREHADAIAQNLALILEVGRDQIQAQQIFKNVMRPYDANIQIDGAGNIDQGRDLNQLISPTSSTSLSSSSVSELSMLGEFFTHIKSRNYVRRLSR